MIDLLSLSINEYREILQVVWRTQLLLLISSAFLWLLEILRKPDGIEQLKNLKEPLWLMTVLCILAAVIPPLLFLFEAKLLILFAMLVSTVWALLFVIDLIMEWRSLDSGNVRSLTVALNVVNMFNAVYSTLWWYQY